MLANINVRVRTRCTGASSATAPPASNWEEGIVSYAPPITVVDGCMDNTTLDGCGIGCNGALNYDPAANNDDGSCIYCVNGCTDPLYVEYDPAATCDNGCNTLIVNGCTDSSAYNYDPSATVDDGTCITACPSPANLTVSNITGTSAYFSWSNASYTNTAALPDPTWMWDIVSGIKVELHQDDGAGGWMNIEGVSGTGSGGFVNSMVLIGDPNHTLPAITSGNEQSALGTTMPAVSASVQECLDWSLSLIHI